MGSWERDKSDENRSKCPVVSTPPIIIVFLLLNNTFINTFIEESSSCVFVSYTSTEAVELMIILIDAIKKLLL